jgi:hypothetical protein
MVDIRDQFEREDGIASAELDDFIDPSTINVHLENGLGDADHCRIDITWTTLDDYTFHYTDSNLDFRWGKHPHGGEYGGQEAHFHSPPGASSDPDDVEESCITVETRSLVVRAVIKLWRAAFDSDSLEPLNSASNPP